LRYSVLAWIVDEFPLLGSNYGNVEVARDTSKEIMSRIIGKHTPLLLLLSLLVVGCSRSGSQFVGKWVNITNASDTMEITQNGEQLLILSPQGKLGATYKDGALQIPSTMGTITLTYIKSSDTLVGPGFFGQSEYKRVDHFATPNGQATLHTPGGTVSTSNSKTYTAEELGTDIYPGAQSARGGMKMDLPGVKMVTGIFMTSDSKDKVVDFYKAKLGSGASVMDTQETTIVTLGRGEKESVMVTVTQNPSQDDGKTKIAIVHSKKS